MKTRIENETVKPAGITYPALFRHDPYGDVWLVADQTGRAMCVAASTDDYAEVGDIFNGPISAIHHGYTHIPGPLTITFNAP